MFTAAGSSGPGAGMGILLAQQRRGSDAATVDADLGEYHSPTVTPREVSWHFLGAYYPAIGPVSEIELFVDYQGLGM